MSNIDPYWISNLLFDKSKFSEDATYTTHVYTASRYKNKKYADSEYKIVVNKGNCIPSDAKVWEQMYKQFECIEQYIGIKAEFYENNVKSKIRYYRLYIDVREAEQLPSFLKIIHMNDNCYIIKVTDARRYIKAWNRVIKRYGFWCMHNNKNINNNLIIPNINWSKSEFYGFRFNPEELHTSKEN